MAMKSIIFSFREKLCTATIYGIKRPKCEWIRYVGIASNFKERKQCYKSLLGNRHLARWFIELEDEGIEPEFVELGIAKYWLGAGGRSPTYRDALQIERDYISEHAIRNSACGGPPLLNMMHNPLVKRSRKKT